MGGIDDESSGRTAHSQGLVLKSTSRDLKKKMFCMSRNSPWTGREDLNASLLNVSIPCLDLLITKKIPKSTTYNIKFLYYLFKWFL